MLVEKSSHCLSFYDRETTRSLAGIDLRLLALSEAENLLSRTVTKVSPCEVDRPCIRRGLYRASGVQNGYRNRVLLFRNTEEPFVKSLSKRLFQGGSVPG